MMQRKEGIFANNSDYKYLHHKSNGGAVYYHTVYEALLHGDVLDDVPVRDKQRACRQVIVGDQKHLFRHLPAFIAQSPQFGQESASSSRAYFRSASNVS
jgi:hypothetical protein